MTPAIERLVAALEEGITDEEQLILGWLSNHVPQRVIATWLNVSYAAATQRIWRLRERLRETLIRYSLRTTATERRELDRFFRRAGVAYADILGAEPKSRRGQIDGGASDEERTLTDNSNE